MKISHLLLPAVALLTATACSNSPPEAHYLVLDLSSPERVQYAQEVLHQLGRSASSNNTLIVDRFAGGTVENFYSDKETSKSIRELNNGLQPVASEPESLAHAFERVGKLGAMHSDKTLEAVLISEGTCKLEILQAISAATATFTENIHLLVVGVSPENRLCLSSSVAPIEERAKFTTDEAEWLQAIRGL